MTARLNRRLKTLDRDEVYFNSSGKLLYLKIGDPQNRNQTSYLRNQETSRSVKKKKGC